MQVVKATDPGGEKVILPGKIISRCNQHASYCWRKRHSQLINTIFPEADGSSLPNENLQSKSSSSHLPGLLKFRTVTIDLLQLNPHKPSDHCHCGEIIQSE